MRAAGLLIRDPDGRILLLRRSDTGAWALPGGHIEKGESAWEAAVRETEEETGYPGPYKNLRFLFKHERGFYTFEVEVPRAFQPKLNSEHTDFVWASSKLPTPLHWGLRWLTK